MALQPDLEPELAHVLEPGEALQATARGTEAILVVSDRRLFVAASERIALSLRIDELRRIQFDIEKSRPATLVIVPEASRDEPQVLAIPPDQIRSTAEALALIAERLAAAGPQVASPSMPAATST
jgi:hypothetical protein